MAKRQEKPSEVDLGTPETRKKLRLDPVDYMARVWGKKYRDIVAIEAAAREIRKIYMMELHGLFPKAVDLSSVRGSSIAMSEYLAMKRRDNYLPWIRKIGSWRFNVLLYWLIEEMNLAEIDKRIRRRKGTAKETILLSLVEYGKISGNIKSSPSLS